MTEVSPTNEQSRPRSEKLSPSRTVGLDDVFHPASRSDQPSSNNTTSPRECLDVRKSHGSLVDLGRISWAQVCGCGGR